MTDKLAKSHALAAKIEAKANEALAGLQRDMDMMNMRPEFRAILWQAVSDIARRRAYEATVKSKEVPHA